MPQRPSSGPEGRRLHRDESGDSGGASWGETEVRGRFVKGRGSKAWRGSGRNDLSSLRRGSGSEREEMWIGVHESGRDEWEDVHIRRSSSRSGVDDSGSCPDRVREVPPGVGWCSPPPPSPTRVGSMNTHFDSPGWASHPPPRVTHWFPVHPRPPYTSSGRLCLL